MTKFKALINKFQCEIIDKFATCEIIDHKFDKNQNTFDLTLSLENVPSAKEYKNFVNEMNNKLKIHFDDVKLNYKFLGPIENVNIIREFLLMIATEFINDADLFRYLNTCKILTTKSNNTKIVFNTLSTFNYVNNYKTKLAAKMHQLGFVNFDLEIIYEKLDNDFTTAEIEMLTQVVEQAKSAAISAQSNDNVKEKGKFQARNNYTFMPIVNVHEGEEVNVSVKGQIFERQLRNTRSGKKMLKLAITDFEEAVDVIFFPKDEDEILKIKEGTTITVFGRRQQQDFKQIIYGSRWKLENDLLVKRVDKSNNKHVELGFHTNMSTMDGLLKPHEIIEQAKIFKHKAVAIIDTNSVQAFPDFYNASKKEKDLKVVYGASISTIRQGNEVFYQYDNNFDNQKLVNCSYIVFDLETTGLSPITDEIIEFGAVLISNLKIVKKWHFLLKVRN